MNIEKTLFNRIYDQHRRLIGKKANMDNPSQEELDSLVNKIQKCRTQNLDNRHMLRAIALFWNSSVKLQKIGRMRRVK